MKGEANSLWHSAERSSSIRAHQMLLTRYCIHVARVSGSTCARRALGSVWKGVVAHLISVVAPAGTDLTFIPAAMRAGKS